MITADWSKPDELDENGDPIWTTPPDTLEHPGTLALGQYPWHHPKDEWEAIRKVSRGKGIRVAVLDTGVDMDHPLLKRPIFTKSHIRGESVEDRNSHGTHCIGTVCANDERFSCAPDADYMAIKVLSNRGSGSSSGIAAGIHTAIDNGADILSMSLGGGSAYQPTLDAIKKAFSKGKLVVVAAGNSGFNGRSNTIGWPARSGLSICVGATQSNGDIANFSSGGEQLDIAAPGQQILSCLPGGRTGLMSGTSMATPMVAGYFALILDIMWGLGYPKWNAVGAVKEFIKLNAVDVGRPGKDKSFGEGIFTMQELLPSLTKGLQFS
jgi:subtilisin